MSTQLVPARQPDLPAILAGSTTPAIRARVKEFFSSLASIFESWVGRRQSRHTQRAYREDVMAFVKFMGLTWPNDAVDLLRVSVQDVQRFRAHLVSQNAAPKTLNRRTRNSSAASPPIRGRKRGRCRRPAPVSSSAFPPATPCSTTAIA